MKIVDLKGKRFGKLIVLENLGSSRGGSKLWSCKCDCGNITSVSTRHLNRKNNVVRSCGCLSKEMVGKNKPNWKGYGEISYSWFLTRIRRDFCKRKKIEISIDIEYIWNLFLKQERKCALTGLPLTIGISNTNNASLDRIDSSKGYIKGNVQWVHKDINKMKNIFTVKYFKELCALVTNNGSCPIK